MVAALTNGLAAHPEVELHVITALPGLRAATTTLNQSCHVPGTYKVPGTAREISGAANGTYWLHRVPHPRGDRLLWHQPAVWPIRRALDAIQPEVVHAHMAGPYADAALRSGRPAVITLHGVVFREAALALAHSSAATRLRWQLDALFERWVVRRAANLIAISPYVAHEYRPLTCGRFHEIENPVADRFFDVPALNRLHEGALRLLCVARIIPRKDILTLIETVARVREAFPAVRLEIAGHTDDDPAYFAACRSAVERLGLDANIHFLGSLGGAELADCYARADLLLLTSRQETAPVVVAEAMAAGRPVVATGVGGVPFMVADGKTGFIAPPGDAAALATHCVNAAARRCDMGRAARAAAETRFRLTAVIERTVALYRELLEMR